MTKHSDEPPSCIEIATPPLRAMVAVAVSVTWMCMSATTQQWAGTFHELSGHRSSGRWVIRVGERGRLVVL